MTTSEAKAAADSRRFGGIARLYGEQALGHLAGAHVCVIGIGGVGSWAAEASTGGGVAGQPWGYWQVSPVGVEVQVVPGQQSLPPGRQNCPRIWQRQVPLSQSIAPQQSSEPAQLSLARRHTQRPPVQSC